MNLFQKSVVMCAALLIAGCGPGGPGPQEDESVRVVATTTIVGDLVRVIGGEDVQVDVLMGAGVDPHLYKASAGDVTRMSSARAIFYNGHHLEGKMSEVLAAMNDRGVKTVAVAECAPRERLIALDDFQDLHDPHVWFDVSLWAETVDCVAGTLAELDPTAAEAVGERASLYKEELAELDAWVRNRIAELPEEQRVLVTAHDAFEYFGNAYGLEVRGLIGVSTAAETGTSDVQELADFIVERKIPAVFVETSVPPRYVQALQEAVAARGFDVVIGGSLYSDALGDPGSAAGSYTGAVRANVEAIVGGLAGETAHE